MFEKGTGAAVAQRFGVPVGLPDGVSGPGNADALDTAICAMQAAWAYRAGFALDGMPGLPEAGEGWIADPLQWDRLTRLKAVFHRYGNAFDRFLALRKRILVDQLHWQGPHNDPVEMGPYDSPLAQNSLVWHGSPVLGGAGRKPTTALWGDPRQALGCKARRDIMQALEPGAQDGGARRDGFRSV